MKAKEEWGYLKAFAHESDRLENHLANLINNRLEAGKLKDEEGNPLKDCICPACIMGSKIDLEKDDYLWMETKKKYRKGFNFGKYLFEQAWFITHMVKHHGSVKKALKNDFAEIRCGAYHAIMDMEKWKVLTTVLINVCWSAAAKIAWNWNKSWTCEHETMEDKK